MQTGRCFYCGSEDVEYLNDGTHYCCECGTQWGTPRYQRVVRQQPKKTAPPPPLDMSKVENWFVVFIGALIATCIFHLIIFPICVFLFSDNLFFADFTTGWLGFWIELIVIYIFLLFFTLIGVIR